jgi:hypothetical protein
MLRDALGSADGGALFFDLKKKDMGMVLSSTTRQARSSRNVRTQLYRDVARSQRLHQRHVVNEPKLCPVCTTDHSPWPAV